MHGCFWYIFAAIMLMIFTGTLMLCKTSSTSNSSSNNKRAGMSRYDYNQQPYSDYDLRLSCLFETPRPQYCPPVDYNKIRREELRQQRRRRQRARAPKATIPLANQYRPNEMLHQGGVEMSSINLPRVV